MSKAILYDTTLCIGCRQCEVACAERWGLPYDDTIAAEEKLSEHKLTAVVTRGERFTRRLCMHCQEPTCVSVCPVGALEKTALGPVVYHEDRCIGCRYCMLACPFQVPAYEWSKALPRVKKCDMCFERQKAGLQTACSEICPTQATISGDRDDLIAEAKRRLAENPGNYYPRIYGLEEVGGTSVLILTAVAFEELGLRTNLPNQSLPVLTWRVLSLVPDVVGIGTVLLGGIWWITHRREEVSAAEEKEKKS
ncbi:MAG TPA: 4Fe-4S dicluster domain-containing protein [Candidatus Acidoferrales bacterium]|nr:4Fe-4S dicluster domain-containing protein [Candidatus Acidoferrales bacterium]